MTPTDGWEDAGSNDRLDENGAPDFTAQNDSNMPGQALAGHAGWRAGAFVPGAGLLGLVRVSDTTTPGQGARSTIGTSASVLQGYTPVGDGSKYMQGADGKYYLTPDWRKKVNDISIDWPGVAWDLATTVLSSLPMVGAAARDIRYALPLFGAQTAQEMHQAELQSKRNP